MDEPSDKPPPTLREEMGKCSMCQQSVPVLQMRVVSGRPLCLGCLSEWYGEDEEEEA
jgi:formylmethanofuran dehydrogenase subunit E